LLIANLPINKSLYLRLFPSRSIDVASSSNLPINKFVNELKKYGYDEKINEKNYDIIKSIDALIEGLKLYHSNKY
jgi:hypothetical protein